MAVFIDVQNMYHSARNLFNARVNFKEVVDAAVAERKLIRSFAYVVRTKTGEEKAFFEALIKEGIETRVKDLQEFYGGAKKADWDVGMAIDAVRTADMADTVVIVSGDGDFLPLIDYLKGRGRRVAVAHLHGGGDLRGLARIGHALPPGGRIRGRRHHHVLRRRRERAAAHRHAGGQRA